MYKVKANILDSAMHSLATNNVPKDAAIYADFTADITAYNSISIIQQKFVREPVSNQAVSSVNYPNILATDVVHPQTGEPLFYYHKIPKITASGKNVAEYISIADQLGNIIDPTKYFVVTTDTETRIYTNIRNSSNTLYFVNAIFFKNTSYPGYVHNMLNVRKALEYSVDYTVTYTNGTYTLSKPLYVTSDLDRMAPVLIPYDYDIKSSWRLEIPPIVMPEYTVNKLHYCTNVFITNAVRLSDGIYRANTYDVIAIKDQNGYVKAFDSYGYIYAPLAKDDTLLVTVIRGNYNQHIPNVLSESVFDIYSTNGIIAKLDSTQASGLPKIATVHVNKSGDIQTTLSDATGGGLEDDSSDTFSPSLFVKLSSMNLRTTADRSTYDATFPVSKSITVAQLPISYTVELGKGDSQRLIDTINASKATGSELLTIDSNGFQITKGYFAKDFNDLLQIQASAEVPAPVEAQDSMSSTDTAEIVTDSPYESGLSIADEAVSLPAYEYSDAASITDSVQSSGNVSQYANSLSLSDSAVIDVVTAYIDIAETDHDVVY